jgi:hypothetical protein
MIPERVQRAALQELTQLCTHAKLKRQVEFYTGLNFEFESYGGSFSFTCPIIVIPYHYLFRPDGSYFGQERANEFSTMYDLTNNETRFYLAREVCHLAPRDWLVKTAAKVLLCTALYFLCAAPLRWAISLPLAACTFGIQLFVKRSYETHIDLQAIRLCANVQGDLKKAALASLSALVKQQTQNLKSRKQNFWCRFYLTKQGNHLLDLTKPNLTSRIEKVQKILEELN